jgi:hypothetical protein
MAGILIYTAAGDSEGTLGGLVRLGRPERLGDVVRRALSRASWCSADPVCSENLGGQGSRLANLAACHAWHPITRDCLRNREPRSRPRDASGDARRPLARLDVDPFGTGLRVGISEQCQFTTRFTLVFLC